MSATPSASLSIWLLPSDAQARLLDAAVIQLAPFFLTPPFTAHVTLQGDLALDDAQGQELAQTLARQLPAITLAQQGLASSPHFFRSLYLQLAPDAAFDAMQAACAALSGTRQGLSPFPHLSLAYGEPRDEADRLVLATPQLGAIEALGPIRLDHLVLARSSKDIPIADWRILARFALA